jgi:hypothetical protein
MQGSVEKLGHLPAAWHDASSLGWIDSLSTGARCSACPREGSAHMEWMTLRYALLCDPAEAIRNNSVIDPPVEPS